MTVANIFAVQDEIAAKVSASVAGSYGSVITSALLRASAAKPPEQLTSYECVLEAFGIWRQLSGALVLRSRDCLEIAVERDPYYADAWAMLSHVYAQQRWFGWGLPESEATDLSKRAHLARSAVQVALRAVAIAPERHRPRQPGAGLLVRQRARPLPRRSEADPRSRRAGSLPSRPPGQLSRLRRLVGGGRPAGAQGRRPRAQVASEVVALGDRQGSLPQGRLRRGLAGLRGDRDPGALA